MFWDIWIAVGISLTQLVVTWYGVHVSVQEHRIRNAFIIGSVGLIGMILTVVGVVRTGSAVNAMQGQLDKIGGIPGCTRR